MCRLLLCKYALCKLVKVEDKYDRWQISNIDIRRETGRLNNFINANPCAARIVQI